MREFYEDQPSLRFGATSENEDEDDCGRPTHEDGGGGASPPSLKLRRGRPVAQNNLKTQMC
jgi:hypothetical protein